MSSKVELEDGSIVYETPDGRQFKSRSGAWKHEQKLEEESQSSVDHSTSDVNPDDTIDTLELEGSSELEEEDTPSSSYTWDSFDLGIEDNVSDVIPTHLKAIAKPQESSKRKKLSKAQLKALRETNVAMLTMGLGAIDNLLTSYGKATTLDKEFIVKHSDQDKKLVANAQFDYMDSRGWYITDHIGTGTVALSLTGWYIGAPVLRIRRKSKVKLLKNTGRILGRIPLIGRFFARRNKKKTTDELRALEVIDVD